MQISGRVTIAVVCAALAAVTIAAYGPVLSCDFVNLDDDIYNPHVQSGLTTRGLKWAFTTSYI